MDEIEMLCLANSRKEGNRCVAGLRSDGTWLRPVSTPQGGALTNAQLMLAEVGRPVEPLDVVVVPVEKPAPFSYQPENWLIADRPWRHLRTVEVADVCELFELAEYGESALFGTPYGALNSLEIPEDGIEDSLALLKVEHPTFYLRERWGKDPQTRARFEYAGVEYAGVEYDLSVTFAHDLGTDEAGRQSASNWWFTVSLGDELFHHGSFWHHKLIAGALRIPPGHRESFRSPSSHPPPLGQTVESAKWPGRRSGRHARTRCADGGLARRGRCGGASKSCDCLSIACGRQCRNTGGPVGARDSGRQRDPVRDRAESARWLRGTKRGGAVER